MEKLPVVYRVGEYSPGQTVYRVSRNGVTLLARVLKDKRHDTGTSVLVVDARPQGKGPRYEGARWKLLMSALRSRLARDRHPDPLRILKPDDDGILRIAKPEEATSGKF